MKSTITVIISRRIRRKMHVACTGERKRRENTVLVTTVARKLPRGRPRCRWKDNTRINLI
jgi:hypothetical protein